MLNIYLQHVFQTIIYFMKIQSQNIFFKNIPAPPPPPLEMDWWPPYEIPINFHLHHEILGMTYFL